jgi:hypothetical protein
MAALLAIVAVATRTGDAPATAPPGTDAAAATGHHVLVVAALVLAPILSVLGAVLFFYAQIYRRRDLDPETKRRLRNARIRSAVFLGVLAALAIWYVRTGRNPVGFLHLRNPFGHGGAHPGAPPPGHLHRAASGGVSTVDWTLAAIVWIALVALAGLAVVHWRATRTAPRRAALEVGPEAAEAEPDLDALRRERNPRRAVIAAYAAMERLMERDRLGRGAHEAPMEYLGRITLLGHDRVGAVHRLTLLYQRARFSERPVDEDMRRRAIAAVEDLAGGAGEPA